VLALVFVLAIGANVLMARLAPRNADAGSRGTPGAWE